MFFSNSAKQGQVLKHLKTNLEKGVSFLKSMEEKEISIHRVTSFFLFHCMNS